MRFIDAITENKKKNKIIVIPDIKCYSPKEGDLLQGRNPVAVAVKLAEAGAPVLSVVTEEKEFHGSLELLKQISEAVNVPILRKDFIHTKEDLIETKNCGASAILLMCSCLEPEEMRFLFREAIELGLEPFVETHNREEMEFAKSLGAKLIGINNRNILELEKDDGNVSTTCRLAKYAPKGAVLVSESSIRNRKEVIQAMEAGADCVLVGTAIWKAREPAKFYNSLTGCEWKICGLMRAVDVQMCMEHGVDILGFVVEYPKAVPWNITREQAKQLIKQVNTMKEQMQHLLNQGEKGFKTCIVTGGSPDKIIQLAKELKPDMIQLHYQETLAETARITKVLHKLGIQIIKAVPMQEQQRKEQFGTDSWETVIDSLCEIKVDGILVDTRDVSKAEKSGGPIDFNLPAKIKKLLQDKENSGQKNRMQVKIKVPKLVVAGGITPENVTEITGKIRPDIIDVMTGVEKEPGIKDKEKLQMLMKLYQ